MKVFHARSAPLCVLLPLALAACAMRGAMPSSVRSELEAMYDSDQMHRAKLQEMALKNSSRSPEPSPEMLDRWQQQQAVDEANLRRLEQIIDEYGWPDRRLVGYKAADASFLVVQHADLVHQKKHLPTLRAAVADGRARGDDLALLEDRILMREGKKQIYGSQLQQGKDGGWEFYPIEDEGSVDERRKAVGLPPLAEYAKQFGIEYKPR